MDSVPTGTKESLNKLAYIADTRAGLAILIVFHVFICCTSLVAASSFTYPSYDAAAFHILYDPARLSGAIAVVAAFALVSALFLCAPFSFGYFVGFYFYTTILGYLWINHFSDLNYDHWLSGVSAAASSIAFLAPALLISSPIRQSFVLSARSFDRLLVLILFLAAATIVAGAIHNFRLVSLQDVYEYRGDLKFPTIIRYSIGITSSALLPFAFASFVAQRKPWQGGATLLLLLAFYPVSLSKVAFFSPAWLIVVWLLAKLLQARTAVVLSLLLPMLSGALIFLFELWPAFFFTVNVRMVAIPAAAMDIYNHYFSSHELTFFCQITLLKPLMACPYPSYLSLVMQEAYHLGNFNASLFATEGIASVGPLVAPVLALLCGLVFAFANRLSAGLPARFILTSSAILPQILLNVPLTTTLVTHGAALIFLLWYITPRTIFEAKDVEQPDPACPQGKARIFRK